MEGEVRRRRRRKLGRDHSRFRELAWCVQRLVCVAFLPGARVNHGWGSGACRTTDPGDSDTESPNMSTDPRACGEEAVASSPHSFIQATQRRTHTGVESVSQFKSTFAETILFREGVDINL